MIQIAAYRGTSLISRAIRWQTRSVYSHVGILFAEPLMVKHPKGRVQIIPEGSVIEAWRGGVRLSASLGAAHTPGTPVDIFSFKTRAIPSAEQQQAMGGFLMDQIGKPYDYRAILRFLTRAPESRWHKNKWFCSELAFEACLTGGHELLERCAAWEMTPRDIVLSPLLKLDRREITTLHMK